MWWFFRAFSTLSVSVTYGRQTFARAHSMSNFLFWVFISKSQMSYLRILARCYVPRMRTLWLKPRNPPWMSWPELAIELNPSVLFLFLCTVVRILFFTMSIKNYDVSWKFVFSMISNASSTTTLVKSDTTLKITDRFPVQFLSSWSNRLSGLRTYIIVVILLR